MSDDIERPPDEGFIGRVTRRVEATERRRTAFLWLASLAAASLIAVMALGFLLIDPVLTDVLHWEASSGLKTVTGALTIFVPLAGLLTLAVLVWPRR